MKRTHSIHDTIEVYWDGTNGYESQTFKTSKSSGWIYVKNKKLLGTKWNPRCSKFEKVESKVDSEDRPDYTTILNVHKDVGGKLLFSIPSDRVIEIFSADECSPDNFFDKSESWGKVIIITSDNKKYELAIKNLKISSEWKQYLDEVRYHVNLRKETGLYEELSIKPLDTRKNLCNIFNKGKEPIKEKKSEDGSNSSEKNANILPVSTRNNATCYNKEYQNLNLLKYNSNLVLTFSELGLSHRKTNIFTTNKNEALLKTVLNGGSQVSYLNEFLKALNTKKENCGIRAKDDAYLAFINRIKNEVIKNAKFVIDEYHLAERAKSYSSDLNLSGSRQFCRVSSDPQHNANNSKTNSLLRNSWNRSLSQILPYSNSMKSLSNNLDQLSEKYPAIQKEINGITYRIEPSYEENSGSYAIEQKKLSLEIQGSSMLMTLANLPNKNNLVYITPEIVVEYKGFIVIAELSAVAKPKKLEVIHALKSAKSSKSDAVLDEISELGKIFNLNSHSIVTCGNCVNNVVSSGIIGYTVDDKKEIYLKNLRSILPLDHICGEDNNKCKHSDASIEKHIMTDSASKESIISTSLNSDKTANTRGLLSYDEKTKHSLLLSTKYNCRLRPEFLSLYAGKDLCSDAFSLYSSNDSEELIKNNLKSCQASAFLRDKWIPMFVNALDNFSIRPLESRSLSEAMHACGINIRYLGLIAKLTKSDLIKSLVHVDLIARASKIIFRDEIRNKIYYFTKIGATKVHREQAIRTVELINRVLNLLNNHEYLENTLNEIISKKYNYSINPKYLTNIKPQALLSAIQVNWGIRIEGELSPTTGLIYKKIKLIYVPKCKFPYAFAHLAEALSPNAKPADFTLNNRPINAQSNSTLIQLMQTDVSYCLHRNLLLNNWNGKIESNDLIAQALVSASAYYNMLSMDKEAEVYAMAAINNNPPDKLWVGLAYYQLLLSNIKNLTIVDNYTNQDQYTESILNTFVTVHRVKLLDIYTKTVFNMLRTLNDSHIAFTAVNEAMANTFLAYELYEDAVTYFLKNLKIAQTSLGDDHVLTGYYAAVVGKHYANASEYKEAITWLNYAKKILFETSTTEMTLISTEIDLNLADVYLKDSDYTKALYCAEICASTRCNKLGNINPYTINAYLKYIDVLMATSNISSNKEKYQQLYQRNKICSLLEKVFLYKKLHGKFSNNVNRFESYTDVSVVLKNVQKRMDDDLIDQNKKIYMDLLSEIIGQGQLNKFKVLTNVESNSYESLPDVANNVCQMSKLLLKANPLSVSLSDPITLSGPSVHRKYAALPEISISVLYKIISTTLNLKLKDIQSVTTIELIKKILDESIEDKLKVNTVIASEVVRAIHTVGPGFYLKSLISRIEAEDPTAASELEVCLDIAQYNSIEKTENRS